MKEMKRVYFAVVAATAFATVPASVFAEMFGDTDIAPAPAAIGADVPLITLNLV
jgi:hypothetical protein